MPPAEFDFDLIGKALTPAPFVGLGCVDRGPGKSGRSQSA